MDIGAKFGFDYALLNDVSNFVGEVDIRGQFVARLALLDTGKINFGLEFQPGVVVEFLTGGPYLGLILPVSGKLGFPITDVVMLNAAIDVPFFLRFSGGQVALALLFGGGVEYLLEQNLALTFNLRFGPVMWFSNNGFGGVTDFGMNALIGVAYKM
jgi:hypothetical protein